MYYSMEFGFGSSKGFDYIIDIDQLIYLHFFFFTEKGGFLVYLIYDSLDFEWA